MKFPRTELREGAEVEETMQKALIITVMLTLVGPLVAANEFGRRADARRPGALLASRWQSWQG